MLPRCPLVPPHFPFNTFSLPFNNSSLIIKAFSSLFNTSPLPFNAFSSPDQFTLSMFNHLKLTELDYPVKSILKRGIILRAPMCSTYVLQIIFKKKMILQSKSPSFMC